MTLGPGLRAHWRSIGKATECNRHDKTDGDGPEEIQEKKCDFEAAFFSGRSSPQNFRDPDSDRLFTDRDCHFEVLY